MTNKKHLYVYAFIGLALLALTGHAQAAVGLGGGGGLPMEAPIQKIAQSLTGPIAFAIALCSIVAAFGAIIFLGHMFGDFVRTLLYIALGVSILAAAPGFMTALGIQGATIRSPLSQEVRRHEPASHSSP